MQTADLTKQSPLGIAIAGLGFGEKVHLPALRASKHLTPVAIWHPRKERLKEASTINNLLGHHSWSNPLNDPNVNGIIIATPPEPRFKLAKEALHAGKHLFLEKPVALNSSEIIELQKLSLEKKLSVAVNFEYRAVPLFMQAKQMLEEGAIGIPWLIKLDWLMSSRANKNRPWNWYSEAEKGGGVIGALGTHAFDLLHWLFGSTKKITGMTSTSIKERPDPLSQELRKVSSEDICLAQLELSGFKTNFSIPTQVSLSAVSRQGRGCWLEIYGSNGTLILGSDNQKDYVHGFGLWFSDNAGKISSIKPQVEFAFNKTWEDGRIAPVSRIQDWWAESIYNGTPIIPGLTEGLLSQNVCECINASSNSGMVIKQ